MDSMYEENELPGNVKILTFVYLVYSVFMLFFGLAFPASDVPPTAASFMLSLVLFCLMPFELLLEYVMYRLLEKRTKPENILGIGALLLTLGMTPAIYGFLIGIVDSDVQFPGSISGLVFTLLGLLLAWTLINKTWESANSNLTQSAVRA